MLNYNYFDEHAHLQYFKEEHPNAEPDDDVDSFNFVQPNGNGVLQLHLQTLEQLGWIVNPEREPMEVYSSCNFGRVNVSLFLIDISIYN